MSDLIERAKKHVEKYKDSIQLKSDKLIEELLNQLEQREEDNSRIVEISNKECPDYPDIQNADTSTRLWAIEQTLEGRTLACEDLHKEIEQLQQSNKLKDDVIKKVDISLHGPSDNKFYEYKEALQALKEGEK